MLADRHVLLVAPQLALRLSDCVLDPLAATCFNPSITEKKRIASPMAIHFFDLPRSRGIHAANDTWQRSTLPLSSSFHESKSASGLSSISEKGTIHQLPPSLHAPECSAKLSKCSPRCVVAPDGQWKDPHQRRSMSIRRLRRLDTIRAIVLGGGGLYKDPQRRVQSSQQYNVVSFFSKVFQTR